MDDAQPIEGTEAAETPAPLSWPDHLEAIRLGWLNAKLMLEAWERFAAETRPENASSKTTIADDLIELSEVARRDLGRLRWSLGSLEWTLRDLADVGLRFEKAYWRRTVPPWLETDDGAVIESVMAHEARQYRKYGMHAAGPLGEALAEATALLSGENPDVEGALAVLRPAVGDTDS